MYFIGLATDYDGTIAHDGIVDEATIAALEKAKRAGRKLVLVTGRELPDLERVFPRFDLFERVVAENGAVVWTPGTRELDLIAPAAREDFIDRLRAHHIEPLSVGHCIVATWEPHETIVLDVIRDMGLDLQITFNKGAVMALPAGVNKASGLARALDQLGLSPQNVVAIGDAENDLAFLRACGCAVAVANALPAVKEASDVVTVGARGAGVAELVEVLVDDESSLHGRVMDRHAVRVGAGEWPALLHPFDGGALIAGFSGGGKSTLATSILERMIDARFQVVVVDPEGDYTEFSRAVAFGDQKTAPRVSEIVELVERSEESVVVNMLGVSLDDRPAMFSKLITGLSELRARTGRPHWLLVDEAHHVAPASRDAATLALPQKPPTMLLVTVDPASVSSDALRHVEHVFAIGDRARETIESFCAARGIDPPSGGAGAPGKQETLYWSPETRDPPRVLPVEKPEQERKRHTRKYAEGALGEDKSFYFRGPEDALNLRAQNLTLFTQIADGVDDATWLHHLRRHDYSDWFRAAIKDEELADEARAIEDEAALDARESRARVREAVERRYTAPASG